MAIGAGAGPLTWTCPLATSGHRLASVAIRVASTRTVVSSRAESLIAAS
jgi:hypothetical protein